MRRGMAAVLIALTIVVGACGGDTPVASTTSTIAVEDLRRVIAADYAASAERAIAGTRYEGIGAEGIMDAVLDACSRLGDTIPDGAVVGALLSLDIPPGSAIDDRIAAEVVIEGLATVCPDDVLRASGIDPAVPSDDERRSLFLGVVAPFVDDAGLGFGDDELVDAGEIVCDSLQAGAEPETAIVAGLRQLFEIEADSLDEIVGAGVSEGLVLGAILASAAVYFCPAQAERVAVFIQLEGLG